MAMKELELTDAQAQALLESSAPLADVYRYFEKLETGHMDVIRDSIENRADDVCRAKEELRTTPIYPHSAAYAREHGEMEQYRAFNNVNRQCNSPNFHNRDRYSICGGRNGVSSPRLPPLFLFVCIIVFCLSVPDNMSRIRSVAKE